MASATIPELAALTAKEKKTLRLIVRGYDAKSSADALDLSVHTINERLRAARRKLGVTSSREAARLLFESEGGTYEKLAARRLGVTGAAGDVTSPDAQAAGPGIRPTRRAALTGVLTMSIAILAALALGTLTPSATERSEPDPPVATQDSEVHTAALEWLKLVDARDWRGSYDRTAAAFRQANTLKLWSDTASRVQGRLGAMQSRRFIGANDVPSPQGFRIVKFHTSFANRADALETLSLVREGGTWKVAGIYVE